MGVLVNNETDLCCCVYVSYIPTLLSKILTLLPCLYLINVKDTPPRGSKNLGTMKAASKIHLFDAMPVM